LLIAMLGTRIRTRRVPLALAAGVVLAAVIGFVTTPSAAILWAALAGVSLGCLFPLSLVLIVDLSSDSHEAASVSGLVLGLGYVLAAATPLLLGLIRDWTGSLAPAIGSLSIAAAGVILLAARVSPRPT
jgi:MFS transporter, CP family, cyanate transporter